jgi:hypothetical protein
VARLGENLRAVISVLGQVERRCESGGGKVADRRYAAHVGVEVKFRDREVVLYKS